MSLLMATAFVLEDIALITLIAFTWSSVPGESISLGSAAFARKMQQEINASSSRIRRDIACSVYVTKPQTKQYDLYGKKYIIVKILLIT